MTARRSVTLVGRGSPEPPTGLVRTFSGLLERGFDAHLLCDGGDPGGWPRMSELPPVIARTRVHPPPRALQRPAPSGALLRALAAGVATHPWAAIRAAVAGGRGDRVRVGDRYLDAMLLAIRPRLVHFTSPWSALRRARLVRAIGCQVLLSFSDDDLSRLQRSGRRSLRRAWRAADLIVFANPWVRERALRLGFPSKQPAVTLSSADPEWFDGRAMETHGEGARPLRILSAGPLSWRQGLEHALDAVRLLLDWGIDCEYRVAGSGDFEPAVGFGRHQLGLERHVTVIDWPDREDLREQLAWADVFLAPAVAPERTALAEARAMGLAGVVTERAAPPGDSLERAGVIEVPPRDPVAVADALSALAADPELRRRLGRAARASAMEGYGSEDGAPMLERLYAELLD